MRNIGKNNIRKRALALLMAVVMIISLLISGGSSSLDFVNAEGEQDLSSFTNSVSYNLPPGGSEGVYAYKTGSTYSFNINFTEIASGDGIRQFANDSYTFTYTLPEQLSVADFSGTEDIPITGTEYGDVTFYGCEYTITNGVLRLVVKFDNVKSPSTDLTSDQAKNLFDTTPNIHFGLNFDGVVKSGSTQINFGGDTNIIMLEEDSSKNIKTNKSASAFNPQTGEVTYTLTLTSEGENNNVSINDTFGSDSFTIDSSSVVVSSNKSSSKTINNQNVTGNTLSGQLDLGNNEVVTISYKAKYNGSLSVSSSDGSSIYYGSETDRTNSFSVIPSDNTTTVNDTPDTSDDTVTAIISIKYPKINKSANGTTVDEVTKEGSITWTITAFSFPGNSLSGKTITDVFGDNFDTATFDLSNVVITKQQFNYESEYYQPNVGEPETISNSNISSSATGWTFNVPDENRINGNECYKYTITYTTPVDASEKTSDYNITNTVSSNISSSDTSTISPGVQMPAEPGSSKSYEYLGNDQVRWTITLDIPVSGISSDSEVSVVDTLPSISKYQDPQNNWQEVSVGPYIDSIVNAVDGITVDYSSKIEGESATASLTDDGFKIVFTKKDGEDTVPGFASNNAGTRRTVTISYVTELNSDWLALMNQRTDISGLREHKNSSVFNTGNNSYTKDATYKADYTVARSIDKSFVSGYAANGSQGTTGTTDSQGNTIDDLPYFRYHIDLEGIDDNSFDSDGNLVISDSFDENLAYFYSSNWEVGFAGVDEWGNVQTRITPTIDTSQSGKVSFTISKNSIPKNSGAYYSKYRMIYFLRIKDKTAESNIAQTAVNSSNQKATLSNTASVDGFGTDDASFDYSYDSVQKSSTGYSSSNRNATFTVTLNPDGIDMDPNKDTIDVTDTYSQNLSIDFNTIHATIDGTPDLESPNNLVHYYASGNVLHLIVPDGKKVVITYDAKAIGFGSLTLTNTVNFYKQDETWSQNVEYTESSSSGGSQASITIFKYEDGDMTVPLPNVVFRLYRKSDDSFIKEFITDSDGKFTIYSADGINYDVPYYVKEISGAPEGYNMSIVNWTFTLVEKLEDVNYSFGVWKYYSGDTLTVSNETTNMSIPVYKKWVGTAGTEAKFELYKIVEGVETKVSGVPTLTLNSTNNWAGSFNDIPRRDNAGNEIQYLVKEIDVPAGYVSDGGIRVDDTSYSRIDKGVNFTNTELSNGTLTITKEVVNGNSSNANDVYSVNVVAQGNETVLDTNSIVVSGADSYTVASDTEKKTVSFTFQKNDTVTISGLPYDYYAITEEAGSYTTTYSVDSAAESSTAQVSLSSADKTSSINIINTYERQKGKLIINKSFKDESNINYPTDHNNVLFNVKITLKDGIEPLVGTKNFGGIEFNNGIAYVNVSGNNNVIIEDIPYDYTYQIEEQEPSTNGYSIVSGTGNGTIDTDEVTETIINTTVGDLEVSKTLVSDLSSDADVDFNFTVTLGDTSINGTYGDMYFSDGVATFSLKGGEVATAEGLPSGITYDVVEASNAAFTTAKTGDTGTIPSIDTATAAFTNTRKTGDLEVSKTVVSSTASDKNLDFNFKVTLSDTSITGTYDEMDFSNGVATFTLKDGESKTATGLPQSVGYTVTEATSGGFVTTKTDDSGEITDTKSEAKFKNTKQEGGLAVTKSVVSDIAADSDIEFGFTVTLGDTSINGTYGDMEFSNGVATFNLKDGKSKSATGLPSDVTYTVVETANDKFDIEKTGDAGTISTTDVSTAAFTNTRKTGDLVVDKILVSDLAADADAEFSFTVTLGDNTINGTYGDMNFSDGVATFDLKGGQSATADELPSEVTYTVTEASNAAFNTTKTGDTGTISSTSVSSAAFTNTRKTGDLEVSKKLVSSTAGDEDINFSFRVTLTDTTINGSYGDMEFNNGVAEFTLRGGESKSAVGLPQSVGYTVTETADDRFTTTSTGETGTISDTEAEVVFTNTRNNTPVQTGSFDITKVINDTGYDSSTEFPITVTLTYPNGVAVSGKYRINNGTYTDITGTSPVSIGTSSNPLTIKTTDTIHFEDLPYGTTYSVSENIPAGVISQGYTLKSISYGSTSNSNGTINASTNDNVTITNNYKKDGKIYLRKYLTGRNWDEIKSLIKFTVYKIDENDNNVKVIEVLGTADGWTYNDTTQEPYYEYVISGLEYTKYKMVEEISGDTNISDYISFHNAVVEFPNSPTTSNRGFETHDFNLIYDADNTSLNSVICKFYNEYFAKSIDLKIKKTGEDSDSSGLGGAGFTLYSDEDCTQVAQSEEITDSNNNYTVTFTGLKPGTDYWYKETTTPNGYIANTTPVKITTTPSDQIPDDTRYIVTEMNATVTNKKTIVKVSKVDVTNDKELPGATIQILDKDGNVVDEWTSTSVPHEIVGLNIEETYTLKETVAPSGYQLTTETTFTLDKFGNIDSSKTTTNQNSAGVLLVEDWPQGSVVVNKRGLLNETCTDYANEAVQLKDVEFTLTKKGDSSFSAVTATTNDNGVAVFDKLDAGTYEIKETKTVDGYILDTNTYIAEIDIHGNYSGLKDSDGNAIEGNMLTNDLYRTDIEFTKVNLDNSNQKLPGSTYGLFAKRSALGTRRGSLLAGIEGTQNITEANKNDLIEIARATTNSKGLVRFAGVLPGVEYTVKELIAPNGFYVSENPISLSYKVDDNGNVVLASLDTGDSTIKVDVNGNITWLEPEVKVSFLKTDESGKPLAGAKLKVVDKDGKDVMSWTSKEEAYTVIGTFTCGETYKLIEVSAPDGYQVAEAVSFTIPGEAGSKGLKPISVVMADKKLPDTSTSTPSKESTPETTVTSAGTSVDTGDSVPVTLITIMLFVALLGCAVTIFLKKKVFI